MNKYLANFEWKQKSCWEYVWCPFITLKKKNNTEWVQNLHCRNNTVLFNKHFPGECSMPIVRVWKACDIMTFREGEKWHQLFANGKYGPDIINQDNGKNDITFFLL